MKQAIATIKKKDCVICPYAKKCPMTIQLSLTCPKAYPSQELLQVAGSERKRLFTMFAS